MKTTHLKAYRDFLDLLIKERKSAGMSQYVLADRLDKPQSHVSKVETGERRLDLVDYVQWTKALNVDPLGPMQLLVSGVRLPRRRLKLPPPQE
ncbi:helix-turn-helix domain-containing protein [Hydrogenophaga sp.]|uniref:helix-turn-helix domain-containing protein n=1 Tax=Hydrogenophaga sp. TaxID=1904254 RepID=UPI0035245BD6